MENRRPLFPNVRTLRFKAVVAVDHTLPLSRAAMACDDAQSHKCAVRLGALVSLASADPKACLPHPRSPCVSPPCAGVISAERNVRGGATMKDIERTMTQAVRAPAFITLRLTQSVLHLARRAFILHCCLSRP